MMYCYMTLPSQYYTLIILLMSLEEIIKNASMQYVNDPCIFGGFTLVSLEPIRFNLEYQNNFILNQ